MSGRSVAGYNWDAPWNDCRRKWAAENIWQVQALGRGRPLAVGSAIHAGLESWYFPATDNQATRQIVAIQTARAYWLSEEAQFPNLAEYEDEDLMMIESLLSGYFERYPSEVWKVLGKPEAEFSICLSCSHATEYHEVNTLPDGLEAHRNRFCKVCDDVGGDCTGLSPYTGKIDLLVEWEGKELVVEHKSSGMDATTFFKTYHLSDQVTGYVWAAKQIYPNVQGALINGLGKGRIAKTKGIAHHWFQRETFLRTPRDLDRWLRMRRQIRAEREMVIRTWEAAGKPGPDLDSIFYMETESCYNWGRACQYLEACLYHWDPTIMKNFYTVGPSA